MVPNDQTLQGPSDQCVRSSSSSSSDIQTYFTYHRDELTGGDVVTLGNHQCLICETLEQPCQMKVPVERSLSTDDKNLKVFIPSVCKNCCLQLSNCLFHVIELVETINPRTQQKELKARARDPKLSPDLYSLDKLHELETLLRLRTDGNILDARVYRSAIRFRESHAEVLEQRRKIGKRNISRETTAGVRAFAPARNPTFTKPKMRGRPSKAEEKKSQSPGGSKKEKGKGTGKKAKEGKGKQAKDLDELAD